LQLLILLEPLLENGLGGAPLRAIVGIIGNGGLRKKYAGEGC